MLASLARLALQQSARLGEGPALNAPVPLCDEDLDEILERDPWVCFCCEPKPIEHLEVRWE